jgi:hypothetical protein
VALQLLCKPKGSLTGSLDLCCPPPVDGHQQRSEEDLQLKLALLQFESDGQARQAGDSASQVFGGLVNRGSGERLLAGSFPESDGGLVLAGGGEVTGDEVGPRRGLVGETFTEGGSDPAVIALAGRAEQRVISGVADECVLENEMVRLVVG